MVQCVHSKVTCDGTEDCVNGVDEKECSFWSSMLARGFHNPEPLPYYIYVKSNGYLHQWVMPHFECNNTQFACRTIKLCLPLQLRCNDVNDCPGHEDEVGCETCPRLYRCRSSAVCVHPGMVCDGTPQCPQRDDEYFCGQACPRSCTCYALSAFCNQRFSARAIFNLRFLEAEGSGIILRDIVNETMLVHVGLGGCGLRQFDNVSLPNVRYLDVSDNHLSVVSYTVLFQFPKLQEFRLDGNPLNSVFPEGLHKTLPIFSTVAIVGLSRVFMTELNVAVLAVFPNLKILNMSGNGIELITGRGLQFLTRLATLDVSKSPLSVVPRDLLREVHSLRAVYADNYKLCCPAMLPGRFNTADCHAPSDEISSCDALLRSDAYRVLLSVFAALALVGNLGSFVYRVVVNRSRSDMGFGIFVTHLSVADFMMGVYLAIIGVADRVYLGSYLWGDVVWKSSAACSVAGFLSLSSSEVSAFIICLITLDRFLVLRFPFSQLRFRQRSANFASGVAWTVGATLSAIPLLPLTSHWEFYRQNGICLPLPITQRQFPGQLYSFGVMIVLNFILFLVIAVGQLSIYYTVKTNRMESADTNKTSKDMAIARRLITVAMSDFLCWFPIGVLGLLASAGVPIPGHVNVAMAILALPLNAALNPFLYTYNMISERRRRSKERRIQKMIMATMQRKQANVSSS